MLGGVVSALRRERFVSMTQVAGQICIFLTEMTFSSTP